QATGKEPTDLARHKKTLPVIYALEQAGPDDRDRLLTIQAAVAPSPAEMAEAIGILERTGARDYTRDAAHRYRDAALAELDAAGTLDAAARAGLERIIVS